MILANKLSCGIIPSNKLSYSQTRKTVQAFRVKSSSIISCLWSRFVNLNLSAITFNLFFLCFPSQFIKLLSIFNFYTFSYSSFFLILPFDGMYFRWNVCFFPPANPPAYHVKYLPLNGGVNKKGWRWKSIKVKKR